MRLNTTLLGSLLLMLIASGPAVAQSGNFGNSVLILDGELIVAEPTTNFRPGTVYLHRKVEGAWQEVGQIQAPEAERADGFGTLLAATGATLFVGQRGGPVYVFERDGLDWRSVGTVAGTAELGLQLPDEPQEIPPGCNQYGYCGTEFGIALAAEGDWLFVGEPRGEGDDAQAGHQAPVEGRLQEGAGVVHAFRRGTDGQWSLQQQLQPTDATANDRFGAALAAASGRILVGAPDHTFGDGPEGERAGRVYEFVLEGGAWREVGPIESRPERNGEFGSALAIDGARAIIGAPGSGDGHGAAFLLEQDPETGTWIEAARLAPFSSQRGDRFGSAVAMADGDIWIGTPAPHGIETGRVYVYRSDPDEPLPGDPRRIRLEETGEEDYFGGRIAAGSGLVAVSALGMHHGAGSVHVYETNPGGEWQDAGMLVSLPDAHEALVGEERPCPEDGGRIGPFDCQDVDLVAFVPNSMLAPPGRERGVRLNDNWGWTDPETGREYALVGRNDGLAFIDITNPVNPVLVGDLPKTPDTPRSQLWRDPKVFQDYVFVVADGAGDHGLQIFDLRRLRDVTNPPETFEPDVHYTRVASVHNININEETGFAAMVGARGGGETCGGGLHMLDVNDPLNPVFLGCHLDERGTHDVQCATYRGPDERYQGRELCLMANGSFLGISDVTDRDAPVVVGRGEYPNPGYTHQGWLTEDHRYFIMDDEADVIQGHAETTRTLIFDVSDVEDPVLAEMFFGSFPASAHNQYVKGNFTYQANYRYGLHVLDISDPENPSEVGHFVTTPYLSGPGFSGAWSTFPYFESGVVLVTSVQDGMFILRPKAPGIVFE